MKAILLISMLAAITSTASAADYSVFRVCQDQRLIRTSDGAEAGHIEYLVVDPGSREIVSTVISGGVLGDHFVAIPYDSLRFSGDREISLTEITRERLVSSPVIERTQMNTAIIAPAIIEKSREHFNVRAGERNERVSGQAAGEVNKQIEQRQAGAPPARANTDVNGDANAVRSNVDRKLQDNPSRDKANGRDERANRESNDRPKTQQERNAEGTQQPPARTEKNANRENAAGANNDRQGNRDENNRPQAQPGRAGEKNQTGETNADHGTKPPTDRNTTQEQGKDREGTKDANAGESAAQRAQKNRAVENANEREPEKPNATKSPAKQTEREATPESSKAKAGEAAGKHEPKANSREPQGENKKEEQRPQ